MCTIEYYSVAGRNEVLTWATTEMNLEYSHNASQIV